ncbi:hypothetical protein RF11_02724 [Thelohanellus kitauei]|uniref:Reverse transcriptase domain-containing protein n=1 Tax=Thelohanellus kitauei TaxID=669202 RepID=A0A0C2IIY3_THEKT|nr:hypothetical protein RF11_02724 [Thelohanellus kitauei]
MDDILIASKSRVEHEQHIETVLSITRSAKASINFESADFSALKEKISTLTDKLKNTEPFEWKDEGNKLVTEIYHEILSQTLICFPNFSNEFTCTVTPSLKELEGI